MAKRRAKSKSDSSKSGEYVRKEIDKIRSGEHGARSAKQAIAIGLSEARRAGVHVKSPKKGSVSEKTRRGAANASKAGKAHKPINAKRSAASEKALKREGSSSVSHEALSRHSKAAAKKRTAAERSASARKAAQTRARSG